MDIAGAIQTWMNVLTHPDEATFAQEQQKPNANLTTALIWIVIAGVISAIFGFIGASLALSGQGPMFAQILDQMDLPPDARAQMEAMLSGGMLTGIVGASSVVTVIMTPIFFLIGTGILHLIARALGGTGEFGSYAYLVATFQAPLLIVRSVVSLAPFLGVCLNAIALIYGLVLLYYATKVAHNLASGRAIAVVVAPIILLLAFLGCIIIAVLSFLIPVTVS
jgi:hypothetical protein